MAAAERKCLNQCADEHLHYCPHEQGTTDNPGWRNALVNLFHFTGTRDPILMLIRPARAKQDAHDGPRVTPDSLHLQVGGYGGHGNLSPPTQGAASHPPAALMYILRDVLVDGKHQAPSADVAWPEPLRPRRHAGTPVWLVTTDDQCTRAAEQAQLWAEWVLVQVGPCQPRPQGLPRGISLLLAMVVPEGVAERLEEASVAGGGRGVAGVAGCARWWMLSSLQSGQWVRRRAAPRQTL